MKQEQIQSFTRRISEGNRSDIIVILYDMIDVDFSDAFAAAEEKNAEEYAKALRHANKVVEHLQAALDFKYEISYNLYSLYDFVKRAIAKSLYTNKTDGIKEAQKVMTPLKEAFHGVAECDTSEPMMKNTQSVVAGYTYGRTDITEAPDQYETSRGFLV